MSPTSCRVASRRRELGVGRVGKKRINNFVFFNYVLNVANVLVINGRSCSLFPNKDDSQSIIFRSLSKHNTSRGRGGGGGGQATPLQRKRRESTTWHELDVLKVGCCFFPSTFWMVLHGGETHDPKIIIIIIIIIMIHHFIWTIVIIHLTDKIRIFIINVNLAYSIPTAPLQGATNEMCGTPWGACPLVRCEVSKRLALCWAVPQTRRQRWRWRQGNYQGSCCYPRRHELLRSSYFVVEPARISGSVGGVC